MSAESIWTKPLTKRQKAVLGEIAAQQKRGDDAGIDFSDVPELTDEQLAQFKRPAKRLVAVRLDADVLAWLQRQGSAGYSTRINHILRMVMAKSRQRTPATRQSRGGSSPGSA